MDHIGGLPNLLWTIKKLTVIARPGSCSLSGKVIHVAIPDLDVWNSIMQVLRCTQDSYRIDFHLEPILIHDGVVFEESGFRVIAYHNRHMGIPRDGEAWKSFSYRIETDDRSIVYSGDLLSVNEIDSLVESGCDLLLMETGHHQVEDVCHYLKGPSKSFGRLVFTHHGLAILADPDGELKKAREILGDVVLLASDGMVYDL
ncbi:MAG: hypothetical protein ISS57_05475 [Anaerolineales bacterium]|nr:hypothetical protein [Anaerolineales bacterium]